jgi:hypothetical protein
MKKILLLSLCLCVATMAFSQTAEPFPTWGKDLIKFISAVAVWAFNNWDDVLGLFMAVLVSLQAFLRIIPTKHNWDFISIWIEWLDKKIPNKSEDGGVFTTTTTKQIDK